MEASSERQLWSGAYDREMKDLPALQVQLVRDVAHRIRAASAVPKSAEIQPVGPEAYDLYLRGVFLAGRGNEADNLAAIELLEKAVAAEPAFAAGNAILARAYVLRFSNYAPGEQEIWEPKAYAAIQKALELDSASPEAFYARGTFLWSVPSNFRHDDAARDYLRAIALRPSFDLAQRQLANVYLHVGLFDEALRHAREATMINPLAAAPRFSIASALSFNGMYEEAVPAWMAARDFLPSFAGGHLAWVLFQLGRKDEASVRAAEALEKNPDDNGGILSSVQALIAADAGQHRLAEAKIRTALQAKHTELYHHGTYFVACAYARMNRTNEALRWLQYTAEDGFPCYPLFQSDQNLQALRSDPRFVRLLDEMKKDWDRRSALARQTP
jgi:tetratricopeptide (TPR) repeat protein